MRAFLLSLLIAAVLVLVTPSSFFNQGTTVGISLVTILPPLAAGGIFTMIAYMQESVRYGIYAVISTLSGLAAIPLARFLLPADQDVVVSSGAFLFFHHRRGNANRRGAGFNPLPEPPPLQQEDKS